MMLSNPSTLLYVHERPAATRRACTLPTLVYGVIIEILWVSGCPLTALEEGAGAGRRFT